jgi:signal recognition particle receptor subunit beta
MIAWNDTTWAILERRFRAKMASINRLKRELLFKIVFYGPGLGGKTTTLQHVHGATRADNRGNMVSLATDTDRTLYFDYLPVKLLKLGDVTVKLQLYTVPGQVYYAATRKLVLNGADGIVFVADSQAARLDSNVESLEDLSTNLAEQGRKLSALPHVFQWNKRDLPDLVPVAELDRRLNLFGAPAVGTVATTGDGVFEVLERITRLVVEGYRAELPAGGGKVAGTPLFLDAEEVGLTGAIRDLADSRPARAPSSTGSAASEARTATPASAPRGPTPPVAGDHLTTPAPAGVTPAFSLAGLWPPSDREAVRLAEHALASRDAAGAVAACDDLLSRILAAGSLLLGGQTAPSRDPAVVVLLLGLDGARYLSFRTATRATRAGREAPLTEALECYTFVVQARQALDRAARAARAT